MRSAVEARRLVERAASSWRLPDTVGHDGALAVSELVTNAVLHAGTPIHVRIGRLGRGLRIEVEDGSPVTPSRDTARPEALLTNSSMTGRGLALVAATSDGWGSERRSRGKVTWAEIGTGRRSPDGDRRASESPASQPPGRQIQLLSVPVELLLESASQLADLNREVRVLALGSDIPPELAPLVDAGGQWSPHLDSWIDSERQVAERAAAAGEEFIDFAVFVPEDIQARIEGIRNWLRLATYGIHHRQLLTLPPSTEVVAYRNWFGEEIIRQLGGAAPRPCPVRPRSAS